MKFIKTKLNGAYLIEPQVFEDERGFFMESYSQKEFIQAGIKSNFVQDNHSLSREKGVLRGLHFQKPPFAQAKLVRAIKGEVYDVIVDLRKKSKTFGKWEGFKLNEKNKLMLYVPRGFAHGFCTLRKDTEFLYKTDNFYAPGSEGGVIWNDEILKIDWPINQPILSEKDKQLVDFKELNSPF